MVSNTVRTVYEARRARARRNACALSLVCAAVCGEPVACFALAAAMVHEQRYLKGPRASRRFHSTLTGSATSEYKNFFRFKKEHMVQLRQALGIPKVIMKKKQFRCDGDFALQVFLFRIARAGTWPATMPIMCNRSCGQLSRIFHFVVDHVFHKCGHTVTDICKWEQYASELSQALINKGCPYTDCLGFIDGTFRHVPRPVGLGMAPLGQQGLVYNRYYGGHGGHGFIGDLFGPVEGARHDARMYRESGLETRLQQLHQSSGRHFYIYAVAKTMWDYCNQF
ncbi:hypothetical protein KFE25_008732 [Diacronema lutheri]|uniref:DDE Tnp4 domain-containing protein n=1 Tax=Diacronema lutheri TaxID=2081491 RepID=A0A8J5XWG7_DIALT|nr:hypothetical protein KFE25_008732 [Diacronema lutheri]